MVKSRIFILYTGGTIGMVPEDPHNIKSPLVPGDMQDLSLYMPSLVKGGYFQVNGTEFTYKRLETLRDSSEVTPAVWKEMAQVILDNYEDHDGFIILHGTDTLAYSSSALSFMLQGIDKPVVFTGSQLPISHPRSDGYNNLVHAIMTVDYKSSNGEIPLIPGVSVSFDDEIFRGNACYKADTSDFGGIYAREDGVLVRFEEEIEILTKNLNKSNLPFTPKLNLEDSIIVVNLFPGFNAGYLQSVVENNAIKGVIFQSFGTGNYWMDPVLENVFKYCHKNEVVLLNTSQCTEGNVKHGKYKASEVFYKHKVISGKDITAEAAITKTMWCLGNFTYEETVEKLAVSIQGEMSY